MVNKIQLNKSLFEKCLCHLYNETGKEPPGISLLLPLAKELKVDVSELLNGEERKKLKQPEKTHSL